MQSPPAHKPLYAHLYFQVLVAIALGVALGYFYPALGARMKPLGDGFIKLIKMMIAPIIFSTVVVGIAKMGDMKEVGRVGIKALVLLRGGHDPGPGDRPGRGQRRAPGRGDEHRRKHAQYE